MVCYGSQTGQDRWVMAHAADLSQFFVDLAANNAECLSNSVRLERDLKWRGVCIEPNSAYALRISQVRTCTLVQSPIASVERNVSFKLAADRGKVQDDSAAGALLPTKGVQTMKTRKLDNVLDDIGAPSTIGYLSLDIEGHEEEALSETFAWHRYTFSLITIERASPRLNERLFRHGYLFVSNRFPDTYYVHESHPRAASLSRNGSFAQMPAHCYHWDGVGVAKVRLPRCILHNWWYCCEWNGYPANGSTRYLGWELWQQSDRSRLAPSRVATRDRPASGRPAGGR